MSKAPRRAGDCPPAAGTGRWSSLLACLVARAPDNPDLYPDLFRLVAWLLRNRTLDPDEAEAIASWFDRLAAGEAPNAVLRSRRSGRARAAGRHVEVARAVREALGAGMSPGQAYQHVAQLHDLKAGTVRNIFRKSVAKCPVCGGAPSSSHG